MSLSPRTHRLPVLFLGLAAMLTGMSCVKTPSATPPVPTVKGEGAASGVPDETFQVKLETTKGNIVIEVHPAWAPNGAAHFRELVEAGFYTNCAFFRVMPGFMCQAGMSGDPEINARWSERTIPDDPVIESNQPGYVTFGKTGAPNSRSTHIFINYGDNSFLDNQTFAPFGKVIEGMKVATLINSQYGERPDQGRMKYEGNAYLKENFPGLDYIISASIIESTAAPATDSPNLEAEAESEPASTESDSESETTSESAADETEGE